jgi:hypothetical protein
LFGSGSERRGSSFGEERDVSFTRGVDELGLNGEAEVFMKGERTEALGFTRFKDALLLGVASGESRAADSGSGWIFESRVRTGYTKEVEGVGGVSTLLLFAAFLESLAIVEDGESGLDRG